MGVLTGEGVAVMGVVMGVVTGVIRGGAEAALCAKVRISSSCTALLLSMNGEEAALTGVMALTAGPPNRCGNTGACGACSPCEMMGIGALMGATVGEGLGEGEEDSNWWKGEWESRGSVFAGYLMGMMFEVP